MKNFEALPIMMRSSLFFMTHSSREDSFRFCKTNSDCFKNGTKCFRYSNSENCSCNPDSGDLTNGSKCLISSDIVKSSDNELGEERVLAVAQMEGFTVIFVLIFVLFAICSCIAFAFGIWRSMTTPSLGRGPPPGLFNPDPYRRDNRNFRDPYYRDPYSHRPFFHFREENTCSASERRNEERPEEFARWRDESLAEAEAFRAEYDIDHRPEWARPIGTTVSRPTIEKTAITDPILSSISHANEKFEPAPTHSSPVLSAEVSHPVSVTS